MKSTHVDRNLSLWITRMHIVLFINIQIFLSIIVDIVKKALYYIAL